MIEQRPEISERTEPPHPRAEPATLSPEGHRLLGVYLTDHRAGATGALARARQVLRANPDEPMASTLQELIQQVTEDTRTLDEVMERVGHSPNRWKNLVSQALERVGRLKPSGRLRRYSPASRILEIEILTAGIIVKRSLWRNLQLMFGDDPRLRDVDFLELARRADAQVALLDEHRQEIVDALATAE